MATNKYFSAGKGIGQPSEQSLIQRLTDEVVQIHGQDFVYCPREIVKMDKLLGEDVLSAFTSHYIVEMYIDNYSGYDGQKDLLSKFGLEITDRITLTCSIYRFKQITGMTRPKEGDLLYFPLGKALFEIRYVDDETNFYPLSTLTTFKLNCELFTYSQETIDTGVEELDTLMDTLVNDGVNLPDVISDNITVQDEANLSLDFDEDNPFGTV